MRIPLIIIALGGICFGQEDNSVVRFSNGDTLSGQVISLGLDKLGWKSQILDQPAEFRMDELVDLKMPAKRMSSERPTPEHEAVLSMTNGDVIKGQLSGLKDDEIRLDTWYAGELVFRRVNVESVEITRSTKVFYRGPNSMDEWTPSPGSSGWTFKTDKLESRGTGGIATEVDFPDQSKISFNASWRGSFRPKIVFYSTDITTDNPAGGYEMVFQGNSVHLKPAGSNKWLGTSTNTRQLREQESAKIEIRFSRELGKILLYIDDEFIEMWEDENMDETELGKGLHLISQNSGFMSISEIEVTDWDGYLGDLPDRAGNVLGGGFRNNAWRFDNRLQEEPEKQEDSEEGRMTLFNGDSVEGEVIGIEEEIITLKTPFTKVKLPLIRLKNIILGSTDMETPELYKGDVRATMADGSRMVFRLDAVEGDTLVGFSQNFGQAKFHKDAFKRIEFDIYALKLEALRERQGW
jgi:hypothetical protein